ncbi:MAG TPA: hypothetical protein VFA28_15165 [Bryobacteraceae bacterium]|nr:hypothetical protein [Bryobacteraceae bacterium]
MSWQAFSWHEMMLQARPERISVRLQPALSWTAQASHAIAAFVAAFLTPLALMEAVLGVWRLCADLGWTRDFFIGVGLLSHWQVWIALAIATQAASVNLNRQLKAHTEVEDQK